MIQRFLSTSTDPSLQSRDKRLLKLHLLLKGIKPLSNLILKLVYCQWSMLTQPWRISLSFSSTMIHLVKTEDTSASWVFNPLTISPVLGSSVPVHESTPLDDCSNIQSDTPSINRIWMLTQALDLLIFNKKLLPGCRCNGMQVTGSSPADIYQRWPNQRPWSPTGNEELCRTTPDSDSDESSLNEYP